MTQCIHHVNFIVRDLAGALPAWERLLGRPPDERDHLAERGVDIARFRLGETWIALVQPVRPDTVPARYLEAHGEGFFLLAIGVDDLEAEMDRLGEAAFSGPPRDGAADWRVRDLDPQAFCGASLQLAASGRRAGLSPPAPAGSGSRPRSR